MGHLERIYLWNKIYWLVVHLPLWKIWESVGMMKFPNIWNNKIHVPNHQPDMLNGPFICQNLLLWPKYSITMRVIVRCMSNYQNLVHVLASSILFWPSAEETSLNLPNAKKQAYIVLTNVKYPQPKWIHDVHLLRNTTKSYSRMFFSHPLPSCIPTKEQQMSTILSLIIVSKEQYLGFDKS